LNTSSRKCGSLSRSEIPIAAVWHSMGRKKRPGSRSLAGVFPGCDGRVDFVLRHIAYVLVK
jgi:hypothetical protein